MNLKEKTIVNLICAGTLAGTCMLVAAFENSRIKTLLELYRVQEELEKKIEELKK